MEQKDNLYYEYWEKKSFYSDLLNLINLEEPLMFDTETIGLYGKIRLSQFYQKHFEAPILIDYPEVLELVKILDKCWVVCHNASYDISTIQENLDKYSWVPKRLDDTFLLSRLFYFKQEKFSLDKCIEYCLGYNPYKGLETGKKDIRKFGWDNEILTDEQKTYSAYDVYYLYKLWSEVKNLLEDINYKLDIITLKNNLRFQCNGLPVDIGIVNTKLKDNNRRIEEINLPINCNSWKQVREYLDSDSSDKETLARLRAKGNKRAEDVQVTRKLVKENSFLKKYITDDRHIYGKFAPLARSGRSTCKDQNLQQLPRSTKGCFGVEKGGNKVMVYSDFSQLELRCICSITGDSAMVDVYRNGLDIHDYTTKSLFPGGNNTKEQRYVAKVCNFSLLYGAGVNLFIKVLLTEAGIVKTEEEAAVLRNYWRNLWPGIKQWQDKGVRDWKMQRPGITPLGRKYVANRYTDQLNIEVQGMGSEVAKLANHYINKELIKSGMEGWEKWQRNFIHDAYIFVVPNEEEKYKKLSFIIADSMQKAWKEISSLCKVTDLPMPVKVDVGWNWGDIDNDNPKVIYTYKQ